MITCSFCFEFYNTGTRKINNYFYMNWILKYITLNLNFKSLTILKGAKKYNQ